MTEVEARVVPLIITAPAVPAAANQIAAGTGSVLAGFSSGVAFGGVLFGLFASVATVVLVFLTISATNRKNKREAAQDDRQRDSDIQAAFDRGWTMRGQVMSAPPIDPPHVGDGG